MGKPVIAPRTKGISDYFDESSIHFFEAGDAQSLAGKILHVYGNKAESREVLERGFSVYNKYRWENQSRRYRNLVASIAGARDFGLKGDCGARAPEEQGV